MPYFSIETNKAIEETDHLTMLKEASVFISNLLGKPESYVMVKITPDVPLTFAGTTGRAAFVQLKSIGLPEARTAELSQALAELMSSELGLPADRVYIEFADAPRSMWGWNGGTF